MLDLRQPEKFVFIYDGCWTSAQTTSGECESDCSSDCDCACPIPDIDKVLSTPYKQLIGKILVMPKSLGFIALDENYVAVFHPESRHGVFILNQTSWGLLCQFRVPLLIRSDQDIAAMQMIEQFWTFGLVEEEGTSRLIKPPQRLRYLTTWIHVSNDCNLRCAYCYVRKTREHMPLAIGLQSIDKLFATASMHGFKSIRIKYAGGEPTLNFDLIEELHRTALKRGSESGHEVEGLLLTNGVHISDGLLQRIRALQLRVAISLDGLGLFHDIQRRTVGGYGTADRVKESIDRLLGQDIHPTITITVTKHNLAGLRDLMRFILDRELSFSINFFRENDVASLEQLRFDEALIISNLRAVYEVIRENLPRRSLLGSLLDKTNLHGPHNRTCGVGVNYMVINHRGEISKCQMHLENPVARLDVTDPLTILIQDNQGLQNPDVDDKEGCRECQWRYWCTGGCPSLTFRVTGRYDVKSPNCSIYKTLFPEVVKLEGLRILNQHQGMS